MEVTKEEKKVTIAYYKSTRFACILTIRWAILCSIDILWYENLRPNVGLFRGLLYPAW